MKITTTVTVTVERPDGTSSSLTDTTIATGGDNPRHEQHEIGAAFDAAVANFRSTHLTATAHHANA